MALVTWEDALIDGRGLSGTRYSLRFQLAGASTRGGWRIHVDGAEICTVDSVESAVRRAEGLEAIRCIIRGLSPKLTEDQLKYAEVIAHEMMDAADQALAAASIGERASILQSGRSLRSVSEAIRNECARREGDGSAFPLAH